jgi:pseudouridine kinase
MKPAILCIGAAAVDRTFVLETASVVKTSNPARAQAMTFGGVARNVAENLARLGAAVSLISAVGGDAEGRTVIARADDVGIDTRCISVEEQLPTAQYVAVLEPCGDLAIGVSAAQVVEAIDGPRMRQLLDRAPKADYWFVECNLHTDALATVIASARERGARLVVDGVSVAKIRRLPERLDGIDVAFCNNDEAASVLGCDARDAAAARALCDRGAARAVVTAGARGAFTAGGEPIFVPPSPSRPTNVTGAGDAFIAASVFALATGQNFDAALRLGAVAAACTVESPQSVCSDLTLARLQARHSAENV